MVLQTDIVAKATDIISKRIKHSFRTLSLHYIPHHFGQKTEALGLASGAILYHPAAETALHLLTRAKRSEESSLIGMAVAQRGLLKRHEVLALCTLNVDEYSSMKELSRHAYHMAWHAINAFQYHNEVAGRRDNTHEIIIRRRNTLEVSSANLQADVFAAVMCHFQGDRETLKIMGTARGLNVLQTVTTHNPEHFPYVIAMEPVIASIKKLKEQTIPERKQVHTALKIAREVGKTFDQFLLRQWLAFSEPAQDMAWQGFSREQILSAAINTSEDTTVRATGYLIAEMTGIKPASIMEIRDRYSPFADDSYNQTLHEKAVDDIFEDVIAAGLRTGSMAPFMALADKQNTALAGGQVMGWCAAALQASGRAFERALKTGAEPVEAARREFDGEREKTTWDALRTLGKKIIDQVREGQSVSLQDLPALCHDDADAASLRKSINLTLQSPAYQPAAAPQAAPSVAPQTPAPQFIAAPAAPGMGMGRARAAATTRKTPPPHIIDDSGPQQSEQRE